MISLASNRVNGIYPIVILVTGKDAAGREINQSFTNFVTITDGIDPNAPADSGSDPIAEPVETPTSAPIVLISNSKIKTNPVEAGKEFEAVITLKNTSTLKSVQNMVATVTVPSSDFELLNESSTIYVGKLGKEKTTELTLRFRVSQGTPTSKSREIPTTPNTNLKCSAIALAIICRICYNVKKYAY